MSKRKNIERAEAGQVFRNGKYISTESITEAARRKLAARLAHIGLALATRKKTPSVLAGTLSQALEMAKKR